MSNACDHRGVHCETYFCLIGKAGHNADQEEIYSDKGFKAGHGD